MATRTSDDAGQTSSGGSPLAAPEHCGVAARRVVVGGRTTAPVCGRPRASPAARRSSSRRAAHPCLADVGPGADDERPLEVAGGRSRARQLGDQSPSPGTWSWTGTAPAIQRIEQAVTSLVGVRGRQRDPQPAGAGRHGRAAGWPGPTGRAASRCSRRREGPALAAEDDRDDRAGCRGDREAGLRPPGSTSAARRPGGAAPSGDRRMPARPGRRRRRPGSARW